MYNITDRGLETLEGLFVVGIQCDTIADIDDLPKQDSNGSILDAYARVAKGSTCFCMENSKLYRLKGNDTWALPTSV